MADEIEFHVILEHAVESKPQKPSKKFHILTTYEGAVEISTRPVELEQIAAPTKRRESQLADEAR